MAPDLFSVTVPGPCDRGTNLGTKGHVCQGTGSEDALRCPTQRRSSSSDAGPGLYLQAPSRGAVSLTFITRITRLLLFAG